MIGYYFDYNTNSCLLDPVSNAYDVVNTLIYYQNNEKNLNDKIDDEKNKRNFFKYLVIIETLIFVFIGVVLVYLKYCKRSKASSLSFKPSSWFAIIPSSYFWERAFITAGASLYSVSSSVR